MKLSFERTKNKIKNIWNFIDELRGRIVELNEGLNSVKLSNEALWKEINKSNPVIKKSNEIDVNKCYLVALNSDGSIMLDTNGTEKISALFTGNKKGAVIWDTANKCWRFIPYYLKINLNPANVYYESRGALSTALCIKVRHNLQLEVTDDIIVHAYWVGRRRIDYPAIPPDGYVIPSTYLDNIDSGFRIIDSTANELSLELKVILNSDLANYSIDSTEIECYIQPGLIELKS
jgi:hypothetical protein